MLMLGFQLVIGVSTLNVFPELDHYIDVVLIVRQIIRNTFLRYFKVYA
jgi:hypothetical protein